MAKASSGRFYLQEKYCCRQTLGVLLRNISVEKIAVGRVKLPCVHNKNISNLLQLNYLQIIIKNPTPIFNLH